MIPTLTPEQRERIKPYERHLHSAFYAQYVVGLTEKVKRELFAVYNQVFQAHENNLYCNYCVLNVCARLGRLFFATVEAPKPTEPTKTPKAKKETKVTRKK